MLKMIHTCWIVALCATFLFAATAQAELQGYWAFDGDLKDVSASQNNASELTGKAAYDSNVPTAIKSTKALSLKDNASLKIPSQDGIFDGKTFTVSMWLNSDQDSPGKWNRVISKMQGKIGFELQRHADTGKLNCRIDSADLMNQNRLIADFFDGSWHHLAITVDGNNAVFYIDGKPKKQVYKITEPIKNTADLIIGQASIEKNRFFTGMIDDLAIWDTVLTEDQINSLTQGQATPSEIK